MTAKEIFAVGLLLILLGSGVIIFAVNLYQAVYRINYPQSAIVAAFVLLSMAVFITALEGVVRHD